MPRKKQKPDLPNARDIFVLAEQFRATARLAVEVPSFARASNIPQLFETRGLYLPSAYMACAAFALELYFKCLIRMGQKSFGRAHDLKTLFYLIGRRRREKIKRCWLDNNRTVIEDLTRAYVTSDLALTIDFDFILSISKDAFTQMRYAYEGVAPHTGWAADMVMDCTRQEILLIHPEWERLRQIFPEESINYHLPHS